jgi:hypothetical protein
VSGGDDCLPNCGNLVLRLTWCQLGSWFQAARRGGLKSPAMLEGPRADWHNSDDPAFWCRGEAPQRLRKGASPVSEQASFAPPPVSQMIPIP